MEAAMKKAAAKPYKMESGVYGWESEGTKAGMAMRMAPSMVRRKAKGWPGVSDSLERKCAKSGEVEKRATARGVGRRARVSYLQIIEREPKRARRKRMKTEVRLRENNWDRVRGEDKIRSTERTNWMTARENVMSGTEMW